MLQPRATLPKAGTPRIRLTVRKAVGAFASLGLLLLLLSGTALSGSGDDYILTWWSISNSAQLSSAYGDYTLGGTIGLPSAGSALVSEDYTLVGNFWPGVIQRESPGESYIYLPLILKADLH